MQGDKQIIIPIDRAECMCILSCLFHACILKKAQVTSNKFWLRLIIKILLTIFKSSGSIQERTTTAAPTTPKEDPEERRRRLCKLRQESECRFRPFDCADQLPCWFYGRWSVWTCLIFDPNLIWFKFKNL